MLSRAKFSAAAPVVATADTRILAAATCGSGRGGGGDAVRKDKDKNKNKQSTSYRRMRGMVRRLHFPTPAPKKGDYRYARYTLLNEHGRTVQCAGIVPVKLQTGSYVSGNVQSVDEHGVCSVRSVRFERKPLEVNAPALVKPPIAAVSSIAKAVATHAIDSEREKKTISSTSEMKMSAREYLQYQGEQWKAALAKNARKNEKLYSLINTLLLHNSSVIYLDTEYFVNDIPYPYHSSSNSESVKSKAYHRLYEVGLHKNNDEYLCHYVKFQDSSPSQRYSALASCKPAPFSDEQIAQYEATAVFGDKAYLDIVNFLFKEPKQQQQQRQQEPEMNGKSDKTTIDVIHHYGADGLLLQSLFQNFHTSIPMSQQPAAISSSRIRFHDTQTLFRVLFPYAKVESRKLGDLLVQFYSATELKKYEVDESAMHTAAMDAKCLALLVNRIMYIIGKEWPQVHEHYGSRSSK